MLSPTRDGFVAVNTSTRLAMKHVQGIANPELPGGVSGDPLRDEALKVVRMVRSLIGPERLLIGCGGVMEPAHARQFLDAGADLVEVYSGMIYAGPGPSPGPPRRSRTIACCGFASGTAAVPLRGGATGP